MALPVVRKPSNQILRRAGEILPGGQIARPPTGRQQQWYEEIEAPLGQQQSSYAPRLAAQQTPRASVAALTPQRDYYREAQERKEQYAREDQLRREDMSRKDAMFNRISSMFSTKATPSRVSRVEGPSAEQEKASRDAAFARAKETAGMNALASMKALDDVVAGTGLTGSTMAAAKQGQIIGGAGSEINEFLRDQAISESDRATRIADTEYQGAVSQRNAELGRQQQMQQALLGLLGGLY